MGTVSFARASDFSLDQLAQAFNIGFTGYYLPMNLTPAGLAEMVDENDVRLSASLTLLVDGEPAGIGLVAIRGERGWIAGMGVGPLLRGQGIGRQLLSHLLGNLRDERVRTAQLEALTVNAPALALYTSMGFRDTRELRVYQGPLRIEAGNFDEGYDSASLRPVTSQLALNEFSHFHQVAPAWQREEKTLRRMRRIPSGLGLWNGGRLLAYTLYIRQSNGFVLFDAGSSDPSPDVRRAHLITLVRHLAREQEDAVARAINIPPGDPLGDAMDRLGCAVVARQREMSRTLD